MQWIKLFSSQNLASWIFCSQGSIFSNWCHCQTKKTIEITKNFGSCKKSRSWCDNQSESQHWWPNNKSKTDLRSIQKLTIIAFWHCPSWVSHILIFFSVSGPVDFVPVVIETPLITEHVSVTFSELIGSNNKTLI